MQGLISTEVENGLKTTIYAFTARKINIETIFGNYKFEVVRKSLRPVHVEIVGADEHEFHMGSLISTVKDRTRCDFQNIPYKKCP